MITQNDINDLVNCANIAGLEVENNQIILLQLNPGIENHIQPELPQGYNAVYIFKYNEIYLKVGKVSGNSNARYQYQHYSPNSNGSTLSKSLQNDENFNDIINDQNIGVWIKENTTRFNILIPEVITNYFLHFTEAFFILRCRPKYENSRV
jgi:hypothetical protein